MVKELVEYIVKSLVDGPDAVRVVCEEKGTGYCVMISVLDQDRGRVIGRNGETIRAIRALACVVAPKDSDVTIEIAE